MPVQQNDKYIGIVTLMDVARQDAKETLAQLNKVDIRSTLVVVLNALRLLAYKK